MFRINFNYLVSPVEICVQHVGVVGDIQDFFVPWRENSIVACIVMFGLTQGVNSHQCDILECKLWLVNIQNRVESFRRSSFGARTETQQNDIAKYVKK